LVWSLHYTMNQLQLNNERLKSCRRNGNHISLVIWDFKYPWATVLPYQSSLTSPVINQQWTEFSVSQSSVSRYAVTWYNNTCFGSYFWYVWDTGVHEITASSVWLFLVKQKMYIKKYSGEMVCSVASQGTKV
jgi:hypothetical protein